MRNDRFGIGLFTFSYDVSTYPRLLDYGSSEKREVFNLLLQTIPEPLAGAKSGGFGEEIRILKFAGFVAECFAP